MKGMGLRTTGLAVATAGWVGLALVVGACSHGPVPPVKDPTKGEFYTNEEILRLPADQRERYCETMDSSLRALKDETTFLQARLDSLTTISDTLRNQSISVAQQTRDLNSVLRDLRLKDKAINSVVVKKGDTLRSLAKDVYGDATRWREIYDANRGAIGTETTPLRQGSRLTIPRKPEDTPKASEGSQ
jgi:nucleoid-associated protein YgaU